MRAGDSLTAASRKAGTSPSTVRRYAGSDIGRVGARYRIVRDRAYRPMRLLSNTGVETVGASRRDASTLGKYWAAVSQYLETGDESRLRQFTGKSVAGLELETDPDVIDERYARGELEFEDIYELA